MSKERETKYFIIGDIHGCLDELKALLLKANIPLTSDEKKQCKIDWRVIHAGDIVAKGPKSAEVIQFCIDNQIKGVMGNHDHEVLVCAKELGLIQCSIRHIMDVEPRDYHRDM